MKRKWDKYINKNKYSECQLITALNAYYYLTGKQYCKQDSQEYEDLVDLIGARYGGAIGIEKAWKKLGVEVVWQGIGLGDFGTSIPLPIEFNVWAPGYGFHSTLMVDYVKKCDCYRITNFKRVTYSDGWIFGRDLYKYKNFCYTRDYEVYRLFGLKGDKKHLSLKRKSKRDMKKFFETYKKSYIEKCKEIC